MPTTFRAQVERRLTRYLVVRDTPMSASKRRQLDALIRQTVGWLNAAPRQEG
jgi:hypothetical protein